MQKTTWTQLDATESAELEGALGSPDKFLSDESDAQAWWLLFGLAAVVGIAACIYDAATDSYSGGFQNLNPFAYGIPSPQHFATRPQVLGFYVAIAVAVWAIYSFVTNHKRRGLAITSYGLARIRGRSVQLFRYRDIASTSERTLGRVGKRFKVLTVREKDGKEYDLYCHGTWAAAARAKVDGAS